MIDPAPFHELAGRRVLVTGASSGIGAAAAIAFGTCCAAVAVHYHANAAGAETTRAAVDALAGARSPSARILANAGPVHGW